MIVLMRIFIHYKMRGFSIMGKFRLKLFFRFDCIYSESVQKFGSKLNQRSMHVDLVRLLLRLWVRVHRKFCIRWVNHTIECIHWWKVLEKEHRVLVKVVLCNHRSVNCSSFRIYLKTVVSNSSYVWFTIVESIVSTRSLWTFDNIAYRQSSSTLWWLSKVTCNEGNAFLFAFHATSNKNFSSFVVVTEKVVHVLQKIHGC